MREEAGLLWMFRKDVCEAAILQLIVETENKPTGKAMSPKTKRPPLGGVS